MQEPGTYNMTIYQGASFDRTFTWRIGTPPANVNLSGYSARMQLRTLPSASTPVVELTTSNGRITLGGSAGTITLALSATETAGIPANTYFYDLELVTAGQVTRLLEGTVIVDGEVTR